MTPPNPDARGGEYAQLQRRTISRVAEKTRRAAFLIEEVISLLNDSSHVPAAERALDDIADDFANIIIKLHNRLRVLQESRE